MGRVSFDEVGHRAVDVEGGKFEVVSGGGLSRRGVLAGEVVSVGQLCLVDVTVCHD